jgi:rhamnosyltransferase
MNIAIAYVLYNPDLKILIESVNSICRQVDKILFIDNNSSNKHLVDGIKSIMPIHKIYLSENTGIANATNIAIDNLIKEKFDYMIISDQDTIYADDYVNNFKRNINDMCLENIAAFVPSVYDIISGSIKPFYIKKNIRIKKLLIKCNTFIYQAISSGMVINLLSIKIIGSMKTELFIDYVDFEWCWRVHHYNWKIVAFPLMQIYHKLGDSVKHIGKKYVPIHNPIREYYIVRNITYLSLNSPYLGIVDKYFLFIKALSLFFGYILLSDNKKMSFKCCLKGFIDGINRRLGKFRIW